MNKIFSRKKKQTEETVYLDSDEQEKVINDLLYHQSTMGKIWISILAGILVFLSLLKSVMIFQYMFSMEPNRLLSSLILPAPIIVSIELTSLGLFLTTTAYVIFHFRYFRIPKTQVQASEEVKAEIPEDGCQFDSPDHAKKVSILFRTSMFGSILLFFCCSIPFFTEQINILALTWFSGLNLVMISLSKWVIYEISSLIPEILALNNFKYHCKKV